jgi:polyhydroxyalkanoate synthesis regulator phasin
MSDPKAISEWRRQCEEKLKELKSRRESLVAAISQDDKSPQRSSLTAMDLQLARQRNLAHIDAEIDVLKKEVERLEHQ